MKEAEEVFGTQVPRIEYIPSAYRVNDTSLISRNELHVVYENEANETIIIEYIWKSKQILPHKIDTNAVTVEINSSLAQLEEYDEETVLIWNLIPEHDPESLFIITLHTPKTIGLAEAVKIAQLIR